jgi:hypothetical protein
MTEKVNVKFIETPDADISDGNKFEKGKAYELAPASANHWIIRGYAIAAEKKAPATKKAATK